MWTSRNKDAKAQNHDKGDGRRRDAAHWDYEGGGWC